MTVPSEPGHPHCLSFPITLRHSTFLGQVISATMRPLLDNMTPAEFEPAIPASERPQTHALDSAAAGIVVFI
jgi:hypothetical protein